MDNRKVATLIKNCIIRKRLEIMDNRKIATIIKN